jgi:hypothetical protein
MKKVLLGTTALVTAGLAVQSAQAADPIELSIGGYQNWATFYTNNDDNPAAGTLPAQPGFDRYSNRIVFDGEVQFRGKTVLDNGLEVGVRFELEGETQGDQMDETYAWIEGSFGTFRVGNDDSVNSIMATAAPYLNYVFGSNSPTIFANGLSQFFSATGRSAAGGGYGTFSTFNNLQGDNASLFYFTPVFNGFQLGVSYAPDSGEARSGGGYNLGNRTGATTAFGSAELYSVAARYDGAVGDIGVTVAAGYLEARSKNASNQRANVAGNDSDDQQAFDAGVVLYIGSWGVGGSYATVDNMRNRDGTDSETFDIGVAYWSDGAWSMGAYYTHAELSYAAGNIAGTTANVSDSFDAYRIQGQYDLGPGVSVTGTLGFDKFSDDVAKQDYDTQFVGAGLMISF